MFPFEQGGLLPALDRNAADVITGSEHIRNAYADKHSLTAVHVGMAYAVQEVQYDCHPVGAFATKIH